MKPFEWIRYETDKPSKPKKKTLKAEVLSVEFPKKSDLTNPNKLTQSYRD